MWDVNWRVPNTKITLFERTHQSAWHDAETTPVDEKRVNSCVLKHLLFWWSSLTKKIVKKRPKIREVVCFTDVKQTGFAPNYRSVMNKVTKSIMSDIVTGRESLWDMVMWEQETLTRRICREWVKKIVKRLDCKLWPSLKLCVMMHVKLPPLLHPTTSLPPPSPGTAHGFLLPHTMTWPWNCQPSTLLQPRMRPERATAISICVTQADKQLQRFSV